MTRRHARAANPPLDRLFSPRAIAVVGASSNLATISGQPVRHLKAQGFEGRIYPVNPGRAEIAGLACYPSVASLPEAPDVAIVALRAGLVLPAVRECGAKGVPFVVVLSSGYAETGEQGEAMQAELREAAQAGGVTIVGPNCQGYMHLSAGVFAGFGPVFGMDLRRGPISLATQSGGFGYAVVSLAEESGLGFNKIVSTGNELGLTSVQVMDHLVDDPTTGIIATYLEGTPDPRYLRAVAGRALAAGKPILVWKVGNTEEGRRASASHTANMGGDAKLYRALIRQTGMTPIRDLGDFIDGARAFQSPKRPAGNRVAVITVSGGAGVLLADACVEAGLTLPVLSPGHRERLARVLPEFGALNNPIDVTAGILNAPGLVDEALRIIVDDPVIDAIAIVNSSVEGETAERIAREIVAVDRTTQKPLFVSWSSRASRVGAAYAILAEAGIPRFETPVRCGRALGMARAHEVARTRLVAAPAPVARRADPQHRLRDVPGGGRTEASAKRFLAGLGFPVTREHLAASADEAARLAESIGFPVVLKAQAAGLEHKTEAGAVRLGLRSAAEVRAAFADIVASVKAFNPALAVEGALVQEMCAGGIELILGAMNDLHFGPVVMFGLGGIYAEVMGDAVFRLAPVTEAEALDMMRETRAWPVLQGARGRPPCDIDQIAGLISRLSAAIEDYAGEIAEIEINPLLARPKGRGCVALDALIRLPAGGGV